MRYVLAVLGSCLLALSAWADTTLDFNPIYSRFDLILDPTALGNVSGLTIRMSELDCSGYASSGTLTTNSDGVFICADDDTGAGGGDPVLIDGSAVGDASGVDLQGGVGVDITFNTGVSPDTASFLTDFTEISSLTWGAGAFTTMTFDAGVTDPTVTAGSGTLTFSNVTVADGNVVDLDAINNSATTEGLLLPQGTAPTGGTAEGQIGWETDVDELLIGTGNAQVRVGLFLIGGSDTTNRGAIYTIQLFADDSGFTNTNAPPIATPIAMTCRNLVVNVFTAPGAGASWVATLQENETNTALTCTISDTNTQCTDTTNTEAIAVNNRLQLSMVRNGTSANGGSGWVMACYPD